VASLAAAAVKERARRKERNTVPRYKVSVTIGGITYTSAFNAPGEGAALDTFRAEPIANVIEAMRKAGINAPLSIEPERPQPYSETLPKVSEGNIIPFPGRKN
jgi:hypothetical protein